MNKFQLFQASRVRLIEIIQVLLSTRRMPYPGDAISAEDVAKVLLFQIFAKAHAVNILVTRLRRRLDMQVLEKMVYILGPQYVRDFCDHYGFPYPSQIQLLFKLS